MNGIEILPAGAADVGEILTLQRAAFVTEAQVYGSPNMPTLTQTVAELAAELAGATALKAVAGTRIVGSVRAEVHGDVLHVGRLIVAPDMQGRGIGGALLAAVEAGAPEAVRSFVLFTGHLSEGNLRLYARHGYRETHRSPGPPGVTRVYLEKPRNLDAAATGPG